MPLPPPRPREHLHTRRILCEGFRREDGLWDIEAHLVDTKSYVFENRHRGQIQPGEPLHEMGLRLTVDDGLVVREVEAATDASPFSVCPDITPAFKALVGLRIGPGWRARVKELLGGPKGCTHLVELLTPLATVAIQTAWSKRGREKTERTDESASGRKPGYIDGCHALASDGPIVKADFPRWYTGPASTAAADAD
jgi:hypothetical protein